MECFDFAEKQIHFSGNQDSMERGKLSQMLQNKLRSLDTTKFTNVEREAVYKFQRRKQAVF